MQNPSKQAASDIFFPSYFARVPLEAMTFGSAGPAAMSHAEFRVFVALCRFRGIAKVVNPTRSTLTKMTGMTPNNISRATRALKDKGWLTIHYENCDKRRKVINYELRLASAEFDHDRADLYEAEDPDYYFCSEPAVNALTAEELSDLLGRSEP
jgi:hypothetical protein